MLSIKKLEFLIKIKKINSGYHIPFLASVCMGIPLFFGLYLNDLKIGLTMSLAALTVVYFPILGSLSERILTILATSFGFIFSYFLGLLFSFNHFISAIVFGLFSMIINWLTSYLKIKPPKSFFFIMLAATASCIPHNTSKIPTSVGYLAIGTIISSIIAIIYSLLVTKKTSLQNNIQVTIKRNRYTDFIESVILGLFMFISLGIGFLFDLNNPYWIPVSCAAVMQGTTKYHVWQRGTQRVLGTFLGVGLCWIVLSFGKTPLLICLSIIVLQFIVEWLVPRNYGIAVIFITPLTILLTEASSPLIVDTNYFIYLRFLNIFLGSFIGAIGGWIIYNEKIHYSVIRKMRSFNL